MKDNTEENKQTLADLLHYKFSIFVILFNVGNKYKYLRKHILENKAYFLNRKC